MCSRCLLIVRGLSSRMVPMSRLDFPLDIQVRTSASRTVSPKAFDNLNWVFSKSSSITRIKYSFGPVLPTNEIKTLQFSSFVTLNYLGPEKYGLLCSPIHCITCLGNAYSESRFCRREYFNILFACGVPQTRVPSCATATRKRCASSIAV